MENICLRNQGDLGRAARLQIICAVAVALTLSGCVSTSESSPEPTVTETVTATEEPTVEETATEEEVTDPDSEENKGYFVLSGAGQVIDLNKDLDDAIDRARNSQLIRLSGNILELSFNLGQLQSLDAPTAVKADWDEAIINLEESIDSISEVLSSFIADEASLSEMVDAIEGVRSRVNALTPILNSVE